MVFDIESARQVLIDSLKNNLNDRAEVINTEKNDTIVLPPITDSSFFENADDNIFNQKVAVRYGLVEVVFGTQSGNEISCEMKMWFDALVSKADSPDNDVRMLRWMRAIMGCFLLDTRLKSELGEIIVQPLLPAEFNYNNNIFSSAGAEVTATLTVGV
ncbi:MAG: hypothetical protein ACUZ8E_17935 [Candidatus Anammoxibacter sp.]